MTTNARMHSQHQSPLLQLPAELQLTIFEYAVQEPEPLLINCACDSSYHGDYDQWQEDSNAWKAGILRPPHQPALTRTCSLIRHIALPMFYKQNTFRAHYCYQADQDGAIEWLDRIGSKNRSLIRDLAFWDLNPGFDMSVPGDVLQLKRSKLCKELNGRVDTDENVRNCCFHRVSFRAREDEFVGLEDLFASGIHESGASTQ